jgi:catechol 2,3-dioxygenase-like lactoylglutathione lyase family enzyme
MLLNHVGIINRNEDQASRFYGDFLGLELTKEALLAPELSEQLFSVSQEIKMMVFEDEGIKVEVFITDFKPAGTDIAHFGIFIDNLSEITEKARESGVELITGKHKEKTVYFLRDFSGNLIEIKQM